MKRKLLVVLSFVAVAGAGALGGAAGWWVTTSSGVVHSTVAGTSVELVALEQLHSGDIDAAVRTLDWDVDRRAVMLETLLSQATVSELEEQVASCQLNRIKSYRAEHPFEHSDEEFGALVARALEYPAGCPALATEPQLAAVSAGR